MKKTLLVVCASLLLSHSTSSMAFGAKGHRITGAIAEHYLSVESKDALKRIMGRESLAKTSTWPDEMRSDPGEFWKKTSPPWHYVTIPDRKTYQQVGAPTKGDAYTALQKFRATLADPKSSKIEKRKAVSFIVHIIGDLHQPLHVGNGKDRGGNDFAVEFYWQQSNLHRVWDSGMIEKKGLSYSEFSLWLQEEITPKQVLDWQSTEPMDWINESQAIRINIYPDKQGSSLSYDYHHEHKNTIETRLKQAGVRIALYLNEIFEQ